MLKGYFNYVIIFEKNQGFIQYTIQNTDDYMTDETMILKRSRKRQLKRAAQFGLDYTILMYPSEIILIDNNKTDDILFM